MTSTGYVRNFNPRSHEGSDERLPHTLRIIQISIHAPTRGATALTDHLLPLPQISIHAPTRGATNQMFIFITILVISIHAPTRGATYSDIAGLLLFLDFNPRSHEGSDAAESAGAATLQLFQSTLPRGERHHFPPSMSWNM